MLSQAFFTRSLGNQKAHGFGIINFPTVLPAYRKEIKAANRVDQMTSLVWIPNKAGILQFATDAKNKAPPFVGGSGRQF